MIRVHKLTLLYGRFNYLFSAVIFGGRLLELYVFVFYNITKFILAPLLIFMLV